MAKMEGRDGRRPGTFWVDNELVDIHAAKIGIHAYAVYTVLVRHSNNNECYPATSTIAKELGISRPTVSKAIHVLETAGLICIEERKMPVRGQTSHMYTILQVTKTAVKDVDTGSPTAVKDVYGPRKGGLQPPVNDVYTNNTNVNKTKGTNGGVESPQETPPPASSSIVQSLVEIGLTPNQARLAMAAQPFTPELIARLKVWRTQCTAYKPGAVLWLRLQAGLLPDDLPAAPKQPLPDIQYEALPDGRLRPKTAADHARVFGSSMSAPGGHQ